MSADKLPAPPVPADADLRDFPFTPIYRARLFGSSFHAKATDSEWRAGVTLWLRSWEQSPPGSLPDDDIELCRLAELARDLKAWKKLRAGAMHGWFKCSDGRLYHKTVADVVNDSIQRKQAQRDRTVRARIAALQKRLTDTTSASIRGRITDEINRLSQSLSQSVTDSVTDSVTESVTRSVRPSLTESKRREGKGREDLRGLPREEGED